VHSFVKEVRGLFAKTYGESDFTQDLERFYIADGPAHTVSLQTLQLPARELAEELIELFEHNQQLFNYVFHMDDFRRMVDETYANPMDCPSNHLCLIQLTCALGGLYKPAFNSRKLFESGLGLLKDGVEDGDIWVLQAYMLVFLYYQIICKRNAMWITIGRIFVQADLMKDWLYDLRKH